MFIAFFVGLLGALSNATSNVLQRGAHVDALAEGDDQKFSFKFLAGVMRRPRWLLGIITMIISFLLQSIGLGISSLAVIQPLLVLELPFALIMGSLFLKESLTNREWIGATLMFCGVIAFVLLLDPQPSDVQQIIGTPLGITSAIVTLSVAAILYLIARASKPRLRASLLGISAGVGFGLTAVVIKDMTIRISQHGLFSIFSSWQVYAMALLGVASVYVFQYALASGRLMYAQPGVTLADPFVAVIWGVAVFNENVRGGFYMAFAMIGVVMAAIGVTLIARGGLSCEPEKCLA